MTDYTELVAEARQLARWIMADPDVDHVPGETLDALADALEAAEAAIQNASDRVLTLRIERDEARRIAEQCRDKVSRLGTSMVTFYPSLPWESPSEGREPYAQRMIFTRKDGW